MKNLKQTLLAMLVASFALVSCEREQTTYQTDDVKGNGSGSEKTEVGYVTFAEGGLTVITDAEEVRSSLPDVNDFVCRILRSDTQEELMSFTYADRPVDPIELEVGAYELHVISDEIPQCEWECPVYGAEQHFSILPYKTTTLDDVKCKLRNIKVTIDYDVDLYNLLEEGSKSSVTIGENSIDFPYTETRAAYFFAPAEKNQMQIDMALTYAGKSSTMSTTIDNVRAGQWRKVTINMPHVNEGNVVFTITIETLTVDEEIVVDVNELVALSEELIPDDPTANPLAPIITWEGHDLAETFQLMASHFDESGVCTQPIVLDTDANNSTIESYVIHISSTNSELIDALGSMSIKEEFDLCLVSASTDASLNMMLGMLGIPTGTKVQGKESVSIALTNLMSTLYNYNGTHTFTLTVTNAAGHMSATTLNILVDKSSESGTAAPSIVWVDHDIKQAYSVTADLKVKLVVSASAGIAAMTVDIISDVLTADALAGLLPTHIDLVNPGDSGQTLSGMGFPTGDQVKDQPEVSFDISDFMGALLGITGGTPCYANFEINVTDNNGVLATETIQLLLNQ